MTRPVPGSITRQLRDLTFGLHNDELVSKLLDIANAVEHLEGNFLTLANITVATADDLADIKSIAISRLDRHYSILESVAKMLKGIPAWRFPSVAPAVIDRTDRTLATLATRLKKVPR